MLPPAFQRRALLASAACLALLLAGLLIAERARVESWESATRIRVQVHAGAPVPAPAPILDRSRTPSDFAAADGLVVWTLANFSWLDFVLNWVERARRAGVAEFFVGCLDDLLLAELQQRGVNAVAVGGSIGAEELPWGTHLFRERGKQKIRFTRSMLKAGLQPLFLDLDAVLLGDPRPLLRAHAGADILISTDQMHPGEVVRGLEACPWPGMRGYHMGAMNVGMARFAPGALPVLEEWELAMNASARQEQQVFNDFIMLDLHSAALPGQWSPYCRALDDQVTVGLLAATLFANGHLFYYQGLSRWDRVALPPLAVHANYISGRAAKRHYMREHGLWHADPPERFRPPGGFLSLTLWLPLELLLATALPRGSTAARLEPEQLEGHVALMEHQLAQVRAAIRLALALGRQLVLPQLWCGPNPDWQQHAGFTQVSTHEQPMPCPLGAVVDIGRWLQKADAGELPPFHEAALLQHPLMQNRSLVALQPAGEVAEAAAGWLGPSAGGSPAAALAGGCAVGGGGCELRVSANQTLDELVSSLQYLEDVAVLELRNASALLAEAEPWEAAAFSAAMEGLVLNVCCAANQTQMPVAF